MQACQNDDLYEDRVVLNSDANPEFVIARGRSMCNLARLVRDINGQPSSSPIITAVLCAMRSYLQQRYSMILLVDVTRDYQKYKKKQAQNILTFSSVVSRPISTPERGNFWQSREMCLDSLESRKHEAEVARTGECDPLPFLCMSVRGIYSDLARDA
jgi:hypothetical protein